MFVSSHDIEEVERLTDRVAIIHKGRLQLDESHDLLQSRFRRVELNLEDTAEPPLEKPADWIDLRTEGRLVSFVHPRFQAAGLEAEIRRIYGPATVESHPMTLREIFVTLARKYRLDGDSGQTKGETEAE